MWGKMVLKIIFKDIMSSIFPFFIKLIHVYTGEHHYQNKVKFSIVYFADVCSENFTYTNTWKQKEFLLVLLIFLLPSELYVKNYMMSYH